MSKDVSLQRLSDTNLMIGDAQQDVRGSKVIDRHGQEIGTVSALFVDDAERKLRMLEISAGGFLGLGARHLLLPVDAITAVGKHEVYVDRAREHVVRSPAYDPSLIERPAYEHWEPYYGYYGLLPYWTDGYMYPHFPMPSEPPTREASALREEHANRT
jgi:sporulation protein YlmC with PRC-barrel domain